MIRKGVEWFAMAGVLMRLNTVGKYYRWGIKSAATLHSRLVEDETTIRHEWHRLMQQDKSITLDDAAEITKRISQGFRNPSHILLGLTVMKDVVPKFPERWL